jgi:hypothetical protein
LGNTDNIYYLRGEAYRFKGDYEKAHADYQKTLELDPKDSRIKSRLEMVGNRKNNEMAVKVSNGINHSFMYLIGISLQSNLMMFLLRSMLGIPFLTLLFWRTFPTWKNIASVILIIFDALIAITFIRLVATWNAMSSLPASIELTILFLLTIFWPLALGISWRWKPKTQKNHILRILCFIAVGFFVGINAWLPVSRIIREFNSPHEVMAQVDSPQGGMTATAFFVHGPTMFNDGETFVNLRRKGSPFQPIAVFRKDFLTDNPDNVMHLTGYDARYVGTDFIWADETHLKILVAGYEQLSKNTKDDYMNHYAIIFDKKLDHWGNVEITYGNQ